MKRKGVIPTWKMFYTLLYECSSILYCSITKSELINCNKYYVLVFTKLNGGVFADRQLQYCVICLYCCCCSVTIAAIECLDLNNFATISRGYSRLFLLVWTHKTACVWMNYNPRTPGESFLSAIQISVMLIWMLSGAMRCSFSVWVQIKGVCIANPPLG